MSNTNRRWTDEKFSGYGTVSSHTAWQDKAWPGWAPICVFIGLTAVAWVAVAGLVFGFSMVLSAFGLL